MMFPFSSTSMFSEAGFLGSPGIVMTSPVKATIKPAPAEILYSFIVISKFLGLPSFFGSSLNEY